MRFVFVLACLAFTSACSRAPSVYTQASRCGGLPVGWQSLENFGGAGDFRIQNRLHLTRQGELRWNETPVTEHTAQSYLELTGSSAYPVPPLLHLVVDEGASCELVERVRAEVSAGQGCSHHNCLEQTPGEWTAGAPAPR